MDTFKFYVYKASFCKRFKRFSCEIHKKKIFWNILELLQRTSVLIQSDKSGQNRAKRKPAMAAPHQAARYLSSCRVDDQCRLRGHVINQILYIWFIRNASWEGL